MMTLADIGKAVEDNRSRVSKSVAHGEFQRAMEWAALADCWQALYDEQDTRELVAETMRRR